MKLSTDFITRTKALFGDERYERFNSALSEEPVVSIRYNGSRMLADVCNPVPWASNACYLENRPVFTGDPLFHAGFYYVQEASSMFLEQVVREYIETPVRALDLCAAPGGKSTHLLSLLPHGSMLVANEPVSLRTQILAENIIKWGNPNVVVTRNEPADFGSLTDFFDFILVDAPCSGEGMFRKDEYAVEQWSISNVQQCAKRQRTILADVWNALRPGGILVYSTCTFNVEENEECVEWIANELGAEVLPLGIFENWGITGNLYNKNFPVYRFIPGYTKGEGFFLSVLRKDGDVAKSKPRMPKIQLCPSKVRTLVENWLLNPSEFEFVLKEECVVAIPKELLSDFTTVISKMKCVHSALPFALLKHGKALPLHSLAMSRELNIEAFPTIAVEREQALMYLHREALSFPDAPMGLLLLTFMGVPLGFVKNIGNRANNLYPAEWRIRKNPVEL